MSISFNTFHLIYRPETALTMTFGSSTEMVKSQDLLRQFLLVKNLSRIGIIGEEHMG